MSATGRAALAALLLVSGLATGFAYEPKGGAFKVFDGTLYRNKPDLAPYGISPVHIIYEGSFWSRGDAKRAAPDERTVRELARKAAKEGGMVVIDIERWPLSGDAAEVDRSIGKYRQVAQWFRAESPGVMFGYYGVLPQRDYWRAIKGAGHRDYLSWQDGNDRLRPLAESVDAIFPSLYTFYRDQEGWRKYAIAQIAEARRYGKPVYVFLWPQYHESNAILGGRFVSKEYWRLQLDTARAHADGVVIWGGWDGNAARPAEWDAEAEWWAATKEFLMQPGGSAAAQ